MTAVQTLNESASTLEQVAKRYPESNVTEQTRQEFIARCEDQMVQVMLFGSYNAGKSSLINALLGRQAATEGEIPQTSKPDFYSWQNCLLMDTPGVNAPIEHEEVTTSQLARSELILFVIRAGDQDVQDVYSRMMAMLAQDKQIFIVFNHELNEEGLAESVTRLNTVLIQQAGQAGVSADKVASIPVMPVNIKTAQRGNEKNSDTLREHSGIVAFEQRFQAWLEALDNDQQYLDRLKKLLQHVMLEPLEAEIDAKVSGSDGQQLVRLGRQRDEIISAFNRLDARVKSFTRGEVNKRKPQLHNLLSSGGYAADVDSGVQRVAEAIADEVNNYLKGELDTTFDAIRVGISNLPSMDKEGEQESGLGALIEGMAINGARQIGADELKQALLYLRGLKIPFLKGRWERTLGGWAGKAAPYLQAAVALYEMFSANQDQTKRNEAEKSLAMQLHSAIEEIAESMFSQITSAVSVTLENSSKSMLEGVEAEIARLESEASEAEQDLSAVKAIASKVQNLSLR